MALLLHRKPSYLTDTTGESSESALLENFSIGQPVVIKSGYAPVPATEEGQNNSRSFSEVTEGQYWFMVVARAPRKMTASFNHAALIVPAFKKPEDWPQPTSSAMLLIQLEGITKGKHAGCDMLKSASDKYELLQGLVASDVRWKSPYAIQSALWRVHAVEPLIDTDKLDNSTTTTAGNEEERPTHGTSNAKKPCELPKDLHNFGYKRLLNAASPQLDKVCALHLLL